MSDWVPPSGGDGGGSEAGAAPPPPPAGSAGPYGAPVPLPPPPGYPQPGYPPPYPAPYGSGYQPAYGPPPPYAGAPYARPPAGGQLPTGPLEYHELHLAGRSGWWWSLLGLVVAFAGFFVTQLVITVPFVLAAMASGDSLQAAVESLADLDDPTPLSMAYLLLNLAVLTPVVWLVTRYVIGLKPGWTSSVRPRLRWGYFGVCLGLAFVALLASVTVSYLLQGSGDSGDAELVSELDSRTRDLALVILLLTPLQAAGEEYGFRGYLMQAFGSLFRFLGPQGRRAVAVLASATIFAIAHGFGQSIPVFFDRFAFGVVAGVLVIVTGGLEAGIAMHVLNNYLAFGFALATGTLADSLNPTGGSWWMIPTTLTQSLVYLGLAWWVARRLGLATRAEPDVLAASRGLVYRSPAASPPATDRSA